MDCMLLSSWNIVYKHNYPDEKQNKLFFICNYNFGYCYTHQLTVFGHFMDKIITLYMYTFPIAGIFGMLIYFNLSKMIRMSMVNFPREVFNFKNPYLGIIKACKDVLVFPARLSQKNIRENTPFFRFELNFFLYGMAFMVISPALPVYLGR